jgi:hypothetical protein
VRVLRGFRDHSACCRLPTPMPVDPLTALWPQDRSSGLHGPALPDMDFRNRASSNVLSNFVSESGSTDFVNDLVRLQAEAAGDDFFLDLGGAAEDPRDRITVSTGSPSYGSAYRATSSASALPAELVVLIIGDLALQAGQCLRGCRRLGGRSSRPRLPVSRGRVPLVVHARLDARESQAGHRMAGGPRCRHRGRGRSRRTEPGRCRAGRRSGP